MTLGVAVPLNPLDPHNLPSHRLFYGPFEKDSKDCEVNGKVNIQNALSSYTEIASQTDKIEKAFCFVSGLKPYKEYTLYKKRWYFLYYWVGEQIWTALSSANKKEEFPSCLKSVCDVISSKCSTEGGDGGGCNIPCSENLDGESFTSRKKFFDFTQNYNAIKDYLWMGYDNCGRHWSPYEQSIKAACKAVQEYCKVGGKGQPTNGEADPYCTRTYENDKSYCTGAMLPKLKCMSKPDLDKIRCQECTSDDQELDALHILSPPSSVINEPVRQATTTTALSSIIGTLATIGAPYLLYKYKPWSSWFGNHSSGNGGKSNRRRKRSSQQKFNELTETSTTVDFTASSETSSTFDPTTVRSTTYTGHSTRNRGANNAPGPHQNISYGSM